MHREEQAKPKSYIVITTCLCDPCPIFYTDAISESILIQCKDPKHDMTETESKSGIESKPANPHSNQQTSCYHQR